MDLLHKDHRKCFSALLLHRLSRWVVLEGEEGTSPFRMKREKNGRFIAEHRCPLTGSATFPATHTLQACCKGGSHPEVLSVSCGWYCAVPGQTAMEDLDEVAEMVCLIASVVRVLRFGALGLWGSQTEDG